jgi:methylenetetrahydrofolate reductase (NADPH)
MKVTEHLKNAKKPFISFEIIPPKRGGDIKSLLNLIEDLAKFNPPFIDITSHAAEVSYEETTQGIRRKTKRKRPGTLGICALIQKKFNIDAVPHILCRGFTREETEDLLIDLQYLEIENVFAIRGDSTSKSIPEGRTVNSYASDLVNQINNMNKGKYLEEDLLDARPSDFCIGVAGYPEKHFEAPNIETDLKFLKKKIENGASYLVTQMFYDNSKFFSFKEKCLQAGINVPIVPGLKILNSKANLSSLPRHFYIDLPTELTDKVMAHPSSDITDIGIEWAYQQVTELIQNGVTSIHFYVMQNSTAIIRLMDKLKI